MRHLIIFTDLDGTLLDYYTYSFEPALPALSLLKERRIPLVICSSKTRKEIEHYRRLLDNHDPFIAENGGGIFIPLSYFPGWIIEEAGPVVYENEYVVIELGARYRYLRHALSELRIEGFDLRGFGDMTVEEVALIAGMSIEEAAMAKERDFDEPFIFTGSSEEEHRLLLNIESKGFHWTRGRFYHILGSSNKGTAVSVLIDLFKKKFESIQTSAVGDSPNDIPMLERVDRPAVVQKPNGTYDSQIVTPGLVRANAIGPEGWKRVIIDLLRNG